MRTPPTRPELDACGIGFTADREGRPSRGVVEAALQGLANVIHRGAVAADHKTADGSGLLVPIPAAVFGEGNGVAVLFVRGDDPRAEVEAAAKEEGLELVDWRTPPTDTSALGDVALGSLPQLVHAVFRAVEGVPTERAAYRLRRHIERTTEGTYVASCSFRTMIYKGLIAADLLGQFYLDLLAPEFGAPFAVFHQRFSTNTLPTWERAQPFRTLCHNGEINAIAGNINRMKARAVLGTEAVGLGPEELFHPVLDEADSDSGMLDSAVELLVRGGRDIRHAIAMLVPEAWEGAKDLDSEVRGFYRYHACLMEPWDGPAGLVFTDGLGVGVALDRNGLRPLRYLICEDGLVVACSEVGAVDVSGRGKVTRGRLGPGEMLFVDPSRGVLLDQECKERIAAGAPYNKWAADGLRRVDSGRPVDEFFEEGELEARQVAHGYTDEELRLVLKPMVVDAKEPVFSMGDDSPLPNIAGRPRPVHHFLRQRFAQVTNPPIDHLRERLVMSVRTLLGPRQPILTESAEAARVIELPSFFIYPSAVARLRDGAGSDLGVETLDMSFAVTSGPAGLEAAVAAMCDAAEAAVRDGVSLLFLDDEAVGPERAGVPSILATGAVHHRLIEAGLRQAASLIVIADDARDVHGIACLLGYGADAICPRLALQTIAADADASESDLTSAEAQERFQTAVEDGVLKILSKMGISTVDSYRGAQIFEVVGLGPAVVDVSLKGTPSVVGGIGWEELGKDALARHAEAAITNPGYYRDKGVKRGGEYHTHNKDVVDALNNMAAAHLLQKAIKAGRDELYDQFAALVNDRPAAELRDLLEMVPLGSPIPLEEVEPVEAICRRFSTGAMSHGSLSREAHETLAEAMNMIGAKSNCGEGGENPERFRTRGLPVGDRNSRIKQIASGRFGVTPEYCAFADELNIKMAQGSKPGEGGQLPGNKVSEEIATLRHTQPGVTLISPPPHHDIYSIEDLAQLIFDLKQVNRFADVSVKLVAEEGVGTIAAGVVKALADVVQISGANGGTGASPLSSIKHAGLPWELGLAETQQMLIDNDLRSRVRVRVDGGFMTGRDVVVAALLGADEYSFGTAAMIAEGCIMLRSCHKDTCKPGIATQRPTLRANFTGTPEGVASYFTFIAQEVRATLASLGLRSMDEAIGRVECLRQKAVGDERADSMDLSPLLTPPPDAEGAFRCFVESVPLQRPRSELGDRLVVEAFQPIWDGDDIELSYEIRNRDRTFGAALAGALALEFGAKPPRGSVVVRLTGEAGQSFGAFLGHGIELHLTGEANDYVGKGMAAGRIVVRPPADDAGDPVLAGNTCLYGATGGDLFLAGSVGERFAVRNSGANAVIEGAGDHCCEYMTGGTVVVLGPVGWNVGAGMTGGTAFMWDPTHDLPARLNSQLVEADRPDGSQLEELRWLIERHVELTESPRARAVLDDWHESVQQFWVITPKGRSRQLDTATTRVGAAT
jgi:glutamate synthase domain-containing protein 2/glutamate synthase domain-containing protein 1/glutamate synthase domain-containing protein 3